jgi:hypothetical protein
MKWIIRTVVAFCFLLQIRPRLRDLVTGIRMAYACADFVLSAHRTHEW